MKNFLLLLSLLPLLSGCVAAAVVGGATIGGAVVYDKRSFKTIAQDRSMTLQAQALISKNRILKGRSHISVATFNRSMLMIGQAQTPALRDYAYKLLREKMKNVPRIYNRITIAGRPSLLQRTNDTWITTKVKTAMLAAKHLHSTQIKVITEASTVYLMGIVSRKQGNLAANVTRHVTGVKKVIKVFEYN